MNKAPSLRQQILATFALATLFIAVVFSLTTFLFAYHIEDRFFASQLAEEAIMAEQQLAAGLQPAPRLAYMHYYATVEALPSGIDSIIKRQPRRTEFTGDDNQHFHLQQLSQGYLLAEVSQHLIVRDIRPLMLKFLLLELLITLLLTSCLAWLIARKLLTPLQQLTALIGNTPQQSPPTGFAAKFTPNEIGQLATTLELSWARTNDFINREQLFTRDLSHELRTPVTISQGALNLLAGSPLSAEQSILVNRLNAAQQQIEQTISSLLALAREQSPAAGSCQLLPVVETSILQQHYLLADKDIQLELTIAAGSRVAIAEAPLLILLNNLLANAFSYTHAGTISISYQHSLLTVSDSGSGIAEDLQSQLFRPGSKGPHSQGQGMGLSIVSRLCEKWQLHCDIQSSEQGTRVQVTLPQATPIAPLA
ncbi:hypothetical protein WG68_09945 [Arsukibacterium ikkense]|uniref:histidine kinase n=1 Tax=Arsukibacterium ikkense TaxID=336831 RepID=A0A0M2V4B9_9GAMM|nr:HAMP domain-containing sensor histidine kinase [Arsukibacterium ikkense]KKO45687.1 hypothetical protein WG68_09945 [Arsukibacterium ikkense]